METHKTINMKTMYRDLVIVFNVLIAIPVILLIMLHHVSGIHVNVFYESILIIKVNMLIFTLVILYYLVSQHKQ